jgi:hypothetical protein
MMEVGRPLMRKSTMEDHSRFDFSLSKIGNEISFSLFCFLREYMSVSKEENDIYLCAQEGTSESIFLSSSGIGV